MLVYFNTMGQIQRQLEYGQLAYLSTTNYTIFAVQEGYEYQEGDMATLSLKRPDGTLLEAEIWGRWTEITFNKNANLTTSLSDEDCLPFVDGETYYGFEFEISDICIFNQTGMYKGTVTINPQNKARRLLSGIIPIYVNEAEINVDGFDMTYSEYTVLINKILELEARLTSGGSSFTEVNISEETANLLTQPGTTELTSSNNAQVYNDLNNAISTPNAKITFNGEYGVSCVAIEGSHFVYGEYGETKTFEYAMPLVIKPRKVIIYKYNTTITLKVITDDQIEFNSISCTVNPYGLNTSYNHHYIGFGTSSLFINDEVNTDKIIFKLIDTYKYVTTPFISSYNGAMRPMELVIPYQDYYFIIGKYKVLARYFSSVTSGSELVNSSNNNSDPFADTPSTSLKGLVLSCINDQGVVDNTLTDEFAQTYFANNNCVIKVMGKGAFYFD